MIKIILMKKIKLRIKDKIKLKNILMDNKDLIMLHEHIILINMVKY